MLRRLRRNHWTRLGFTKNLALSSIVSPHRPISQGRSFRHVNTFTRQHHHSWSKLVQQHASLRRQMSTGDSPNTLNISELDKFTRRFLLSGRHPVGSLSVEDWEDSISALNAWLSTVGNSVEHSQQQSSGYSVDAADRILERLHTELASYSVVSRSFSDSFHTYGLAVFEAWLKVSEMHTSSLLAVERSHRAWMRLVKSYVPIPSEDFVRLVQAWSRIESSSNEILNLLLLDMVGTIDDPILCNSLVPCFQQTYRNCFSSGDPDASLLLERMQILASQPGWENLLDDITNHHTAQIESSQADISVSEQNTGKQSHMPLSPYEAKQLKKRLLVVVENLESDESTDEVIDKWNETDPSEEETVSFTEAVFRFYMKTKNPKEAGIWLQRLSALENTYSLGASTDNRIGRLCSLIQLWSDVDDGSQTPWRADELLRQLEYLEADSGNTTKTDAYSTVASLWIKYSVNDTSTGNRKALEILQRMPGLDVSVLEKVLESVHQDSNPPTDVFPLILTLLEKHWEALPAERHPYYAETTAQILASSKASSYAGPLLKFLRTKGVLSDQHLAAAVCELSVKSFSQSTNPDEITNFLDTVDTATFNAYKIGVEILLDMRNKRRIDHIIGLISKLLNDVSIDEIQADRESLMALLLEVMDALTYFQRETDAMTLLDLADANLGEGSKLPAEMYKKVMALQLSKGNTESVEDMFHRMKSNSEHDPNIPPPDNDAYNMYIVSLSKRGDDLEMQEELLNELIHLYTSTGSSELKPLERSFNRVLSGMIQVAQKEGVLNRMSTLLDKMITLKVEMKEAFAFNAAMQIALRQNKVGPFPVVMKILKQMALSGVPPDEFTLHNVLTACGRASPADRETALSTLTDTLGKVRAMEKTEAKTYLWAFRSLKRLIPGAKDARAGKLAHALVHLCFQDGFLNEATKSVVKQWVGEKEFEDIYHDLPLSKYEAEDGRNSKTRNVETVQ